MAFPDRALRNPHRDTQRTPSLLIATPFLRILTARLEKFVVHGQAGRRGRLSWWPLYQTERAMSQIGTERTCQPTERCLLLEAKQKTSALSEYFAF